MERSAREGRGRKEGRKKVNDRRRKERREGCNCELRKKGRNDKWR